MVLKIPYVNLDRRPDRNQEFIEKSQKIANPNQYEFVRYPAVDGTKLEITPELCHLLRNNTFGQRRNVVGCALSHINFWEKLVKEGSSDDDYRIIVEDDVNFCSNFAKKYEVLKTLIPNKKNLHLIWICYRVTPHLENKIKYNDTYAKSMTLVPMRKNNYWCGTEGYLITKRGAKFLLHVIKNHGLRAPIDTMMMWAMGQKFGKFNDFGVVPRMGRSFTATQNNNVDSDIQGDMIKIKYNLEIITTDPEVAQSYPSLITQLQSNPNFTFQEVTQIPDPPQSNTFIFISTLATATQIPKMTYKCPIIYLVSDPKVIQLETLATDPHFLCTTPQIQGVIKSDKKSNLTQNIINNIENYYFDFWKKHYKNK